MNLRNNGQQFLDLVEHVERFSRGDHPNPSTGFDDSNNLPETLNAFPLDGETL
jgi:hypothetical protein